jgi:hypothetical protein
MVAGGVGLVARTVRAHPAIPTIICGPLIHSGPGCSPWKVVASANIASSKNDILHGAAAISSSDVWAVGYSQQTTGSFYQTLTEHWNGSAWSIVASPNGGTADNKLQAVAAISSSDVWAVGYSQSSGTYSALIEHWNGATWSIVPSGATGVLYSVAALATDNVWAVGMAINPGGGSSTLVEHWDGSSWSVVPSPNGSLVGGNHLYGVAAVATNDIWAVGGYGAASGDQTLVEHWDGNTWSVVPSPNGSILTNELFSVAAASSGDVWAVGFFNVASGNGSQTLIEHWNGTSWNSVPSANCGTYNSLSAVAVVGLNNVWAVGGCSGANGQTLGQAMAERWNGTNWSYLPTASTSAAFPGAANVSLNAIAVASASDIWAVGYAGAGDGIGLYPNATLVERANITITRGGLLHGRLAFPFAK